MTHYGKLGDMPIKIEIECRHPAGIADGCPTRSGNCEECRHCFAVMPAKQAIALAQAAGVAKE